MSNASMLERLSCNIFITNFPAYFSSKDLWNTCSKFETVLDVYIPNKVSKQGTKTSDSQKSHSNVPLNTSKPSYAKVLGKKESPQNHDEPVIVLEEEMLNFEGEPVLVGITLRAWSKTTFNKIAKKWGELVFMDDSNSTNKYSLCICVKTTFFHLIAESLKVIIKGRVYAVRAKEVTGWVPDFGEENPDESKDYSDNNSTSNHPSGDPFDLDDLIRKSAKKSNKVAHEMNDSNPKFPPSFTPQHSDHYEYEKVEALRESTTPKDSKKETKMVSLYVFVVKNLWGNMLFDFATSSDRGRSGGILCAWDKLLFHKKRTYATEHCLCVEGTFGITCWRPLIVGMVRSLLWEISMRGYSFTRSNKHASKMRKLERFLVSQGMLDLFLNLTGLILHRHLSDHRPILLKETHVDYGPTPFRLYHSWFFEDDFHSVIEDSWNNDGNGLPDDLTKRANLFRDLKDIDHKDSIDLAQKAKIKWAVEGDENSKFFHGIVNKKRRHLAIKGILVDEDMVSNEEIKRAIWDCGSDKSPGPDGFTFEFFKKFWTIVGGDVTNSIKEFFISSYFPKGCNSSFIALIPKVIDAKHLKDFRPISLIGCQYKIIGKILANRLSLVIGDIKAFDSVRWDHLDDIL
nr:RNA-directed DNA polymerase, eukaryota [Tanacetum cinerariifolium]